MRRAMPPAEHPQTDNEQLRDILAAIQPEQWRQTLERSGVPAAAQITEETRGRVGLLLQELSRGLDVLKDPIRKALQELLDGLAGKTFDSLETKQAVAREAQDLLTRLGLRVACPKEGCGRPAMIRCAAAGNSKQGVFQFDHSSGTCRRTTHLGSSSFPRLTIVPAPADRRRASSSS